MSQVKRVFAEIIAKKIRQQLIDQASAIIEQKFDSKIRGLEIFARIFYSSVLSSYTRANTLGSRVGVIIPELEPITKALYSISRTKANKQGSFELSKAFDIANTLKITYTVPLATKGNVLTYKLRFTISHPLLIALEQGDVSWENVEKSKLIGMLESALATSREREGKSSRTISQKEIQKTILQLKKGSFKIIKNKRPYMELTVKNLARQKDFINILIK